MPNSPTPATPPLPRPRRPWAPPEVEDLPHLNKLTLQSIPGNCGTPGSGSTCF